MIESVQLACAAGLIFYGEVFFKTFGLLYLQTEIQNR